MKLALLVVVWATPALALACPACARDAGPNAAVWIAAMIGAPYGVAWWVARTIRRMGP